MSFASQAETCFWATAPVIIGVNDNNSVARKKERERETQEFRRAGGKYKDIRASSRVEVLSVWGL